MPTGYGLASEIAANTNISFSSYDDHGADRGDPQLKYALKQRYRHELVDRLPALRSIISGIYGAESIDSYIDRHYDRPHVAEVGKFLIAFYLLRAERNSRLKIEPDRPLRLSSLADTWIDTFAHILMQDVGAGAVSQLGKDIEIITFNYDRCIERYLQAAIEQAYHLTGEVAQSIVNDIRILRPYGSLGGLGPSSVNGRRYVPFGDDSADYSEIAKGIRTFTEQIEDEEELARLHSAMARAEHVVFLGFGFNRQNVRLLTTKKGGPPKHFYFSGKGVYAEEIEAIKTSAVLMVDKAYDEGRLHFGKDLPAAQLMKVYRRALTQ